MAFQVLLHATVTKTLAKLPERDRRRIRDALKVLAADPIRRRPGADVKRLSGTSGREDFWRLRIGDYRDVYAIQGDEILVTDLFVRGRGYEI